MTRRDDYESWTLESIEQLNAAQRMLREATRPEERRKALRLVDLAHEEAVDAVEARDAGGRSVRSFPAGFSGGR
ncbi:MAG: hypothetical protein ACRD0W_07875 [Acidimicrobiales bacterium]